MAALQPNFPPLPFQDGVEFRLLPFDDRYCASDDGRIFSRAIRGYPQGSPKAWRELKQYTGTGGYPRVCISSKVYKVHRLILLAFCGPPTRGSDVRHLDGSRTNNHIRNLLWGTSAENAADRVAHGRSTAGERHPFARLTNAEAMVIRALRLRHPGQSGIVNFLVRWFGRKQSVVSKAGLGLCYKQ